ncbi:MAG: hypothetical protein ACT4OI_10310 [Methanobacteriota archaeon]
MRAAPRTPGPRTRTYHLVIWWMAQAPYAAVFGNRIAAEAAARVRNAVMVTLSGCDVEIDGVNDFYRRDEEDRPMPAEWRDLVGQVRLPWGQEDALADAAT